VLKSFQVLGNELNKEGDKREWVVVKEGDGGKKAREIHLLTRKGRRLIHWHCSRDPPNWSPIRRMQTQSPQRVTQEMIDEGIGEKVTQKKKRRKKIYIEKKRKVK